MPNKIIDEEAAHATNGFDIHTGQECDVLIKSAGDGASGSNWHNHNQAGTRIWSEKGATHEIVLGDPNEYGGAERAAAFEMLTREQNIDSAFAFYYICGVLAPPATDRPRIVGGFIDLNDVMQKIGWLKDKPNAAKRDERRMKIWNFLRFFASARVVGDRSVPYKNPETGEVIKTRVEAAPWSLDSPHFPEDNPTAAPVKVRVVISSYWEPLLTSPHLTQFMPLGELLGGIPSGKTSGDWARTMGLTLARLWRMKPQETRAKRFCPSRRQLLTSYTPKASVWTVLEGKDPKHAVRYYIEALQILVERGFIAAEGDAAEDVTVESMLEGMPRKGWGSRWLDIPSGVYPGINWSQTLDGRADALPVAKPQNLKRRGRPRKTG